MNKDEIIKNEEVVGDFTGIALTYQNEFVEVEEEQEEQIK